jgi:hypothetical protein
VPGVRLKGAILSQSPILSQSLEWPVGAKLPDAISRLLARPDLRIAPHERSIAFAADLPEPFIVDVAGHVRLGPACLARGEAAAVLLRHALELALLLPRLRQCPALAGLAAARTAALFAEVRGLAIEPWHQPFAVPTPPAPAALRAAWPLLSRRQAEAPPFLDDPTIARLSGIWDLLGPAEALLQTGGDQRLRVDPATGLNAYGCAHRPRPWAVTFASSTASSSSERGFAGAEAARQMVTQAALTDEADAALAAQAATIRAAIAAHAGLPAGGEVVLAASGTDCELIALALVAEETSRPVTNLLVAPEETGSGVPLAAIGCHFATDTARGALVRKGDPVAGFPAHTTLVRIAARGPDGALRPIAEIDADCARAADQAVASGACVILHLLDISKTGYLAPSEAAVRSIADRHPHAVRVVVDACQGRLRRARTAAYLERGWLVLLTGSKFLTGPPFAGAIVVPPQLAHRLATKLPAGLADYCGRPEWPPHSATAAFAARANYGLLLRWQAALAEWDALAAVPEPRAREILVQFGARVRQAIAANPDLALLPVDPPPRPDESWDSVQTIIPFIVRPRAPLDPADARRLYTWLNADLRPALPLTLGAEQERLACLRCHIGQPVPLAAPDGTPRGVLRLSAGARLVSGEPSHHDLDEDSRLLREIRDALSVLDKISLILQHWDALAAADPKPSF